MPVVYRCGRCGYILDVFVKVGQNSYGVPTPSEVLSRYDYRCPSCGAPLSAKPRLIRIRGPLGIEEEWRARGTRGHTRGDIFSP